MKTCGFALGVLLLLPLSPSLLAGESPQPVSARALYFRIDAGVKPGHVVTGWLDERKGTGTGYDAAFLDLDGDGRAETVQEFSEYTIAATKATRLAPKVTIPLDGAEWVLDLQYSRLVPKDGKATTYFRWSVKTDDLYAWFINGHLTLFTSAKAAAEAPPIRLGPPFSFRTGSAVRGRHALVQVGLEDKNGATMRLARYQNAERRPTVELLAGGKAAYSGTAAYG